VLEDPAEEVPITSIRAPSIRKGAGQADDRRNRLREGRSDPIDGKRLSPANLLSALNKLGHDNGIGRLDLVEKPVRRHEIARHV